MKTKNSSKTQLTWGWRVAVYLFLVGVGTGAYVVGFIFDLLSPGFILVSKIAVSIAAPLIILGILFLEFNLGKKSRAFLVFRRPLSSWIARGTVLITIFIALDLVSIGLGVWPSTSLENATGARLILEGIASVFAVLTLLYTGLLLKAAKPIPFWNTLSLPVLFLVSGISTGMMFVAATLLIYGIFTDSTFQELLVLMGRYNIFIIIIEALVIGFYMLRMSQLPVSRSSVQIITGGSLAGVFWSGVVVAGMVVPFVFGIYGIYLNISDPVTMLISTLVVNLLGLAGGFMLRYIVINGGTNRPLNVNGVLVPRPDFNRIKVYQ